MSLIKSVEPESATTLDGDLDFPLVDPHEHPLPG
jgi:hypothetical protein